MKVLLSHCLELKHMPLQTVRRSFGSTPNDTLLKNPLHLFQPPQTPLTEPIRRLAPLSDHTLPNIPIHST